MTPLKAASELLPGETPPTDSKSPEYKRFHAKLYRLRYPERVAERRHRYHLIERERGKRVRSSWVKRDRIQAAAYERQRAQTPEGKARDMLRKAFKSGKIKKPTSCSVCGRETIARLLHGHHHDYNKPFDVVWVCLSCHQKEHNYGRKY